MNDLERIREIERIFGFELYRVEFDHLFSARVFRDNYGGGFRNYHLRDDGVVTGLVLEHCPADLLPDGFFAGFGQLQTLALISSPLSNYTFLATMKFLTRLDLIDHQIREPAFLKELKALTSLNLTSNQISDLSFLRELKALTSLNLMNNRVSDVSFLGELKSLTSLNLMSNQVVDASILAKLESLTWLDLMDNQISDASFLAKLKSLSWLDLSDNQISDGSFLVELTRLTYLNLKTNPVDTPPRQILDLGLAALQDYFKQVREQGVDRIYEAKMLIVGEPGAGKSTLFEKMKDPKYLPGNVAKGNRESTVGVRIESIPFSFTGKDGISFIANLWDFGGQPIQYILHQYFFTERSLYVLLADNRKQLTNFPYWFEIIATMGRDCPVLVVLNEIDHKSVSSFDLTEYQKEFGQKIKSIDKREVDFDDNSDGRFNQLREEIERKLCGLQHIGQEVPSTWAKVRESIQNEAEHAPHIPIAKYNELCKKAGVDEKYRRDILRYFHDLGVALNYEADENLQDIVILSPNWVIDALYVVLKNTAVKDNAGRFDRHFVFDLWRKAGYERQQDHKFLLGLMQKGQFEVAYRIGKTNEYIVPALLPFATPEYEFSEVNLVQIYFEYGFMPPGILARLIVRLHENIVRGEAGKPIVWEKGVLLERNSSRAEVTESAIQKQIRIRVSGERPIKNREFLTILGNELNRIHRDWFDNRLTFSEKIPCGCVKCKDSNQPKFYTLAELEERIENSKETIECPISYKNVVVRGLLEGVYIQDNRQHVKENVSAHSQVAANVKIIGPTTIMQGEIEIGNRGKTRRDREETDNE